MLIGEAPFNSAEIVIFSAPSLLVFLTVIGKYVESPASTVIVLGPIMPIFGIFLEVSSFGSS